MSRTSAITGLEQGRGANIRRTALRSGAVLIGLAAAGVLVIQGSGAAFTANTKNEANKLAAGTVVLSDDDAGVKMFNLSALNGGQVVSECISVAYDGTLDADVRLHGTGAGTLAPGLAMTVEIGTGATSATCDGFVRQSSLYAGTLAGFSAAHSTYATGLGGFAATGGATTTKSYKITFTVSNDNNYQGTEATADFTWEAQGKNAA